MHHHDLRAPARSRASIRLLAAAIVVALAACSAPPADDTAGAPGSTPDSAAGGGTTASVDSARASGAAPVDTSQAALLARADSAVAAIAARDWRTLAALVHPERGLRITPYGHVAPDGECQVTLTAAEVAGLGADGATRCWGHFDGSGEPMQLTFDAYYERFVYDKPYRGARRGAPNERLGQGNTLDNAREALGPGASYVEYHVPGTEQYGGMDWGSLRLVFVPHDGAWRLVGLVHDQWTI